MPFDPTPTGRPDPYASDNERRLYGEHLLDVRLLRQRGFGVHMEDR